MIKLLLLALSGAKLAKVLYLGLYFGLAAYLAFMAYRTHSLVLPAPS